MLLPTQNPRFYKRPQTSNTMPGTAAGRITRKTLVILVTPVTLPTLNHPNNSNNPPNITLKLFLK